MSILTASEICFSYSPASTPIFVNFNFEIHACETYILVGDNGCGKTTLGKILTGLLPPQIGTITVAGYDLIALPFKQRPSLALYMGQLSYLQFFTSSIADEIRLAARMAGKDNVSEFNSAYSELALPDDRNKKPMDLSYMEMWRLQLFLLAIIFKPTFLFIDEIVAPNAAIQKTSVEYVVNKRVAAGQATVIAYQRALQLAVPSRPILLSKGVLHDA